MEKQELTGKIIGCAMKVHSILGSGFLESVYHNAMIHELSKAGLKVESKKKIIVMYDGIQVGEFESDLFVEESVIVENKAVLSLAVTHEVQTVNYLTATGIEIGLLLNFGVSKLEFKRKHRKYLPKQVDETE